MRPPSKLALKSLLFASAFALCLAAGSVGQRAQESAPQTPAAPQSSPTPEPSPAPEATPELVTSYPPGSTAVFPEPVAVAAGERAPAAFIRGAGEDAREWVLSAELGAPEPGPDGQPAAGVSRVSFTVPQLPKGAYVARYEPPGRPGEAVSMNLFIVPELHAADGLVEGAEGADAEVQVGLDTVFLVPRGEREPVPVRVAVTLASSDPSVVDVRPGEPRSAQTDADGYANWKVRLNRAGHAMLRASAPGFEPAEVLAVVAPRERGPATAAERAERRAERAVDDAERDADEEEEDVRLARARAEREQAEALVEWQAAGAGRFDKAVRDKSKADARVSREQHEWYQSLDRMRAAEAAGAALAARTNPEDHLLPGDVLLIRGGSYVSEAIRLFERGQFNQPVDYSHAALYVGEVNGQRQMVAEMLKDGFVLQPLKASMKDDNIVDVYRWRGRPGLTPDLRRAIVARALGFRGKEYAWSQIDMLRVVAGVFLPGETNIPLGLRVRGVDWLSGGELKMICSEMVSWSYHHAGLDPDASRWWPALAPFLEGDARRHDYTTPNTLAVSGNFHHLTRLKPLS